MIGNVNSPRSPNAELAAGRENIDGVEQLTRYLELLNRDPLLAPVSGVFAAQEIKPQARTLAEDRGIRCVVLDYDELRGIDNVDERLF
jgi:RecB family endonuclease NucS